MVHLDGLVTDNILSYLPIISQVSVSRGLGRCAVKSVSRYSLMTKNIVSGRAYRFNPLIMDDIYNVASKHLDDPRMIDHIRRVLIPIMRRVIINNPELLLKWRDFGSAEDAVVGVLRDYLYINEHGDDFIGRKCDDVDMDIRICGELCDWNDSNIYNIEKQRHDAHMGLMNKLLECMVVTAGLTYNISHSNRVQTALNEMIYCISESSVILAPYR